MKNYYLKYPTDLNIGEKFQLFGSDKVYKVKKIWYDYKREKLAIKVSFFKTLYLIGHLQVILAKR